MPYLIDSQKPILAQSGWVHLISYSRSLLEATSTCGHKKARGLMARYIIDKRVEQPEQLKAFDYDGYAFNEAMSEGDTWVFTRDHA